MDDKVMNNVIPGNPPKDHGTEMKRPDVMPVLPTGGAPAPASPTRLTGAGGPASLGSPSMGGRAKGGPLSGC